MMNTRAGATVPAAVMNMGNMRGSVSAASSTALYPPMLAIELSASMLCAREIRGISSMANRLMLFSARDRAASNAVSGSENPITV